ncbi:hypothetical protein ACIBM4_07145 [Streptomyces sp. NPDC050256]
MADAAEALGDGASAAAHRIAATGLFDFIGPPAHRLGCCLKA